MRIQFECVLGVVFLGFLQGFNDGGEAPRHMERDSMERDGVALDLCVDR